MANLEEQISRDVMFTLNSSRLESQEKVQRTDELDETAKRIYEELMASCHVGEYSCNHFFMKSMKRRDLLTALAMAERFCELGFTEVGYFNKDNDWLFVTRPQVKNASTILASINAYRQAANKRPLQWLMDKNDDSTKRKILHTLTFQAEDGQEIDVAKICYTEHGDVINVPNLKELYLECVDGVWTLIFYSWINDTKSKGAKIMNTFNTIRGKPDSLLLYDDSVCTQARWCLENFIRRKPIQEDVDIFICLADVEFTKTNEKKRLATHRTKRFNLHRDFIEEFIKDPSYKKCGSYTIQRFALYAMSPRSSKAERSLGLLNFYRYGMENLRYSPELTEKAAEFLNKGITSLKGNLDKDIYSMFRLNFISESLLNVEAVSVLLNRHDSGRLRDVVYKEVGFSFVNEMDGSKTYLFLFKKKEDIVKAMNKEKVELLAQINAHRASKGLKPLMLNRRLYCCARKFQYRFECKGTYRHYNCNFAIMKKAEKAAVTLDTLKANSNVFSKLMVESFRNINWSQSGELFFFFFDRMSHQFDILQDLINVSRVDKMGKEPIEFDEALIEECDKIEKGEDPSPVPGSSYLFFKRNSDCSLAKADRFLEQLYNLYGSQLPCKAGDKFAYTVKLDQDGSYRWVFCVLTAGDNDPVIYE